MIVLEVSVFNLRHWTTRFIPPEVNVLEYEGYDVRLYTPMRDMFAPPWAPSPNPELIISNIYHPIRTVFVRPRFGDLDVRAASVSIRYVDAGNYINTTVQVINGYTPSFYIPLGAMGTVEHMIITVHDPRVSIDDIYFNMPLPWAFQWARVFVLTIIVSLVLLWKKFGFSRFVFDAQRIWQRCVNAGVVAMFIGILFTVMVFTMDLGFVPGSGNGFEWNPNTYSPRNINDYMVEALLMGQLHLDMEPHESLLNATQPYSRVYRATNNIHAPWDHVFYNGLFYSYFGITPVVVLFLPYYLLRDQHLSATMATFVFSAITAMGIYFIWKELVKKYLSGIPYTLFIAGLIAALFGSNLMLLTVRAFQYEVAIASGLMFSVWGLFAILRAIQGGSYETIKKRFLFIAGTCLALAVGCRPTMIFSSMMVPVLLFPIIRLMPLKGAFDSLEARKTLAANILAFAAPYAAIGAALAWYNFARFGSIFEFGASYQLTAENVAVVTHTGLLGNLRRVFDGIFAFLFASFNVQVRFFPYVIPTAVSPVFTGHMPRFATTGAFMLPMTWFLPAIYFVRKKDVVKKAMPTVVGMAAIGVFIAVLSTVLIGVLARYTVDFFWLIVFSTLICMGLVYKEACKLGDGVAMVVRRMAFAAVLVSCFILFNWGMIGEDNLIWRYNPVVMRFLSDLFMIL